MQINFQIGIQCLNIFFRLTWWLFCLSKSVLFFLERRRQLVTKFEGYTIDSMLMRNSVTGNQMWLLNKVDEISDEEIEKYMKK